MLVRSRDARARLIAVSIFSRRVSGGNTFVRVPFSSSNRIARLRETLCRFSSRRDNLTRNSVIFKKKLKRVLLETDVDWSLAVRFHGKQGTRESQW